MNQKDEEYEFYLNNLVGENEYAMTPEEYADYYSRDAYLYYFDIKMKRSENAMTREEFDEQVQAFRDARDKHFTPEQLKEIRENWSREQFEGTGDFVGMTAEYYKRMAQPIKNKLKAIKERKEKKKAAARKKNKAAKKARRRRK